MDGETPVPGYTALAERLLAHRLARPGAGSTLAHAFRSLAAIFALDHAAAAGEPPRAIISTLAAGLVEAIGATSLPRDAEVAVRHAAPARGDCAPARRIPPGKPAAVPLARFDGEIVGTLELFRAAAGGRRFRPGGRSRQPRRRAGRDRRAAALADGRRPPRAWAGLDGRRRRSGRQHDPGAHPGDGARNPRRRPRLDHALRFDDGRALHHAVRGPRQPRAAGRRAGRRGRRHLPHRRAGQYRARLPGSALQSGDRLPDRLPHAQPSLHADLRRRRPQDRRAAGHQQAARHVRCDRRGRTCARSPRRWA